MTGLEECRESFRNYLGWNDNTLDVVDVVLSGYVSNYMPGAKELVWVFVLGPASTGKTEVLKSVMDYNPDGGWPDGRAIPNNSMTSKAFISGFRDPERPGYDPSLMQRLQGGGVLISPDMTTMLAMRQDDLQYIMGQMRGAFDQRFDAAAGNAGTTTYKEGFGWIGACTEALDDLRMSMQVMGERALLVRNARFMGSLSEQKRLQTRMRNMSTSLKEAHRKKAAHQVCHLLDTTIKRLKDTPTEVAADDLVMSQLDALATAVTRLRTVPLKKGFAGSEGPQRFLNQLRSLCTSRAHLENRSILTSGDVRIAVRVCQDTLPPVLSALASQLHACSRNGVPICSDTMEDTGILTRPEVLKQFNQWHRIGVLDKLSKSTWQYTAEFREILRAAAIFEETPNATT